MRFLIACVIAMLACATAVNAADAETQAVKVSLDMRADFLADHTRMPDGSTTDDSRIGGYQYNLKINGHITPRLSYNFKQYLNKVRAYEGSQFGATAIANIDYRVTDRLTIGAGKQTLMIGGFEYWSSSIDLFFWSMYFDNIACYQFGASCAYATADGKHVFTAQASNSPYQKIGESCYAYSLMWSGRMGAYESSWSTNLIEYERGKYTHYISLGNKLAFGGFHVQLDVMNRAVGGCRYLLDNYSVIGEAKYFISPVVAVYAKGGVEKYRDLPDAGTRVSNKFVGGGVEVFPLRGNRDLHLHAVWHTANDIDSSRLSQFNIGVKWKADIFSR